MVLDANDYLQLDDLVVVRTQVPKMGEVSTYGIVTEVSSRYEGTSFDSDTYRVAVEGTLPAEKSRTATVQIVRVLPETWIAPDAGQQAAIARYTRQLTDKLERVALDAIIDTRPARLVGRWPGPRSSSH